MKGKEEQKGKQFVERKGRKRRKKEREKEDFLAFGRSKLDSSRTKSWSRQWDLRVDTKKLEF